MIEDHPRKMRAAPVARQKYQGANQDEVVQNRVASKSVPIPSTADHCHVWNLSWNAEIERNNPIIVNDEANTSIQAVLPAAGCVTISMPTGTPAIAGTR